jgi:CDP-paratose 2-epimerase
VKILLLNQTFYPDVVSSGQHLADICCFSDLGKARRHHPAWDISKSLDDIFEEIYSSAK